MTNTPKISVIVPVYKVERYIKSCVDSILAQTFQDFEIILVDDASPDACAELCQKLYGANEKVRLVRHEKNSGLSASRNTGMKYARGKYICFVDSDDLILSDALEKFFNAAERTDAQVVHAAGRYELEQEEPLPVRKENLKLKWDKANAEGFLTKNILSRLETNWKNYATWPMAWLCFCRRDFLEKNHVTFLNIISEDETFSFALLYLAERYYVLHEALYVYRKRNGSIMATKDTKNFSERIQGMILGSAYLKNFLDRLPNFNHREEWCESLLNKFFDRFTKNKTTTHYEKLTVSPQVNAAAKDTLKKFFGTSTDFVKFFFHGYHIYRRQAEMLAQRNQQASAQIFSLFERMELSPRKIVFVNFIGKGYGCNPKYIAEEILRQKLPYDLVWLVNNMNEPMPAKIRKVEYKSLAAVYELATAKVIVSNTKNVLPFPNKKDGQYFIMTWHGGLSFKRIEKDTEETLSQKYIEQSKFNSEITDLIPASCRVSFEEIRRAFWYSGEILKCGLPRHDIFFRRDDTLVARIRKALLVPPENKIALYAPTFRKDSSATDVYTFDTRKLLDALREKFGGQWTLLVRFHPNIANLEFAQKTFATDDIINATNYPDIQELIFAADVLVSDYSSVIYDCMLCDKPVFIFAKDFDTYPNERKFNQAYFDLPYKVNRTETELFEAIRNFDAKDLAHKRKKFMDALEIFDTGHASEEVVKKIKAAVGNEISDSQTNAPEDITSALDN